MGGENFAFLPPVGLWGFAVEETPDGAGGGGMGALTGTDAAGVCTGLEAGIATGTAADERVSGFMVGCICHAASKEDRGHPNRIGRASVAIDGLTCAA